MQPLGIGTSFKTLFLKQARYKYYNLYRYIATSQQSFSDEENEKPNTTQNTFVGQEQDQGWQRDNHYGDDNYNKLQIQKNQQQNQQLNNDKGVTFENTNLSRFVEQDEKIREDEDERFTFMNTFKNRQIFENNDVQKVSQDFKQQRIQKDQFSNYDYPRYHSNKQFYQSHQLDQKLNVNYKNKFDFKKQDENEVVKQDDSDFKQISNNYEDDDEDIHYVNVNKNLNLNQEQKQFYNSRESRNYLGQNQNQNLDENIQSSQNKRGFNFNLDDVKNDSFESGNSNSNWNYNEGNQDFFSSTSVNNDNFLNNNNQQNSNSKRNVFEFDDSMFGEDGDFEIGDDSNSRLGKVGIQNGLEESSFFNAGSFSGYDRQEEQRKFEEMRAERKDQEEEMLSGFEAADKETAHLPLAKWLEIRLIVLSKEKKDALYKIALKYGIQMKKTAKKTLIIQSILRHEAATVYGENALDQEDVNLETWVRAGCKAVQGQLA
eukprot:TRINITY_DN1540_c0_g1_i4.p1 TRINITY_DN1540_c0_g1~~TRINITY_DN1540_c0_g1_i4.p1  ORF type:complete len:487 (-),score=83.94 TRINITY_DN1540_c0_g1_i4:609-2069(-)